MFLDDNRGIEFDTKPYDITNKHEIHALTEKGKNQYYDSQIRRLKKIPKDFMEKINEDINGYKFEEAEIEKKKWEEEQKKIKENKEKEIKKKKEEEELKKKQIKDNQNKQIDNKKVKKPIQTFKNYSNNTAVGRFNNNLIKVAGFEDNTKNIKIDKDFLEKFQKKNIKINKIKG